MYNKFNVSLRGGPFLLLILLCCGCAAIPGASGFHSVALPIQGRDAADPAVRDFDCLPASMTETLVEGGRPGGGSDAPIHRHDAGSRKSLPKKGTSLLPPVRRESPVRPVHAGVAVYHPAEDVQTPAMPALPASLAVPVLTASQGPPEQSSSQTGPVRPLESAAPAVRASPGQPVPESSRLQAVPPCGEQLCPLHAVQAQEIDALTNRIMNLEARLNQSDETIRLLNTALKRSNEDVSRLTNSVKHWQNEVKRLEATMKSQHETDISSITSISESLELLLADEIMREAGNSGDNGSREDQN